ncbi:MAG: bifunctional DNA primase/polymerase, partial [Actinomycetota bacterium]|nr:bifunctional DNA primase/polymerase [Actinomycetota bacterium]
MKDSNPDGDGARLSLRKLAEEQPEDAAEHAAAYTRMGIAVVPNEGKKPCLKAWPKRRLAEEELPARFADGQNVGLVNGEPSGGLVAVDMDVPEASVIADRFLPETSRSGREGTP